MRAARAAPWLAFALALAWLGPRALPGLSFEDSGELAAAAATWGVPHPPGYPLLMLVGRAWTALAAPLWPDPVRALNLLSAASGAGAAALVAAFVLRAGRPGSRTGSRAPVGAALAAALLLPASATFAAQAAVTEVYALAALVQAALLLAATTGERPLARSALLLGLALAAHPGSLFLAPLVGVALARERRAAERRRPLARDLARAVAWTLPGLALYAYVPLAAAQDPPVDWGRATTAARLADHLLRAQYGTGLPRDPATHLAFLAEQTAGQWPLALALAALALALLPRRVPRAPFAAVLATLVATCAGLYLAVDYPLDAAAARWRIAGSFTPAVLLAAALAGLGLAALESALAERLPSPAAAAAVLGLAAAAAAGAPLAGVPGPRTLSSPPASAEPYAREVLDACPADAVLVVSQVGYSDVLHFPLLYAQAVRGERPDVLVLNRELLPLPWYREELALRHGELAPALAELERSLASAAGVALGPAERRVLTAPFFPALCALGRPVAFVTRPGPRLLGAWDAVPGPVLWHVARPDASEPLSAAPPAGAWLRAAPARAGREPDPWLAALRGHRRELDLARAARLAERGDAAAAGALRAAWAGRED